MSRFDAMYPKCGSDCNQCGLNCKRAMAIDAHFAGRLAIMLECVILDPHGHFTDACVLLDEYKTEWEKVNPSPPTFMGEPMPPERRERLKKALADRAEAAQKSRAYHADGEPLANPLANHGETCGSPCTGVNPADVRADVRATPDVAVATSDVALQRLTDASEKAGLEP